MKKNFTPSAKRLEDAPRPGQVRADPVLHVADELALEPDHQHHGDQQEGEGHDDLEQDDDDVADGDVAGEQRVHQTRLHPDVGHGVTVADQVAAGSPGGAERHRGAGPGDTGVGGGGDGDRAAGRGDLDRRPGFDAEASKSWGLRRTVAGRASLAMVGAAGPGWPRRTSCGRWPGAASSCRRRGAPPRPALASPTSLTTTPLPPAATRRSARPAWVGATARSRPAGVAAFAAAKTFINFF